MKSFLENQPDDTNTPQPERLLGRNEAGDASGNVNSFPGPWNHNSRGKVEDRFNRSSGRASMAVAKTIEIIAGSAKDIEDAVRVGIAKASETVKAIEGAWVKDTKVVVQNGSVAEWRVTLAATFLVE
jgi:dodecin